MYLVPGLLDGLSGDRRRKRQRRYIWPTRAGVRVLSLCRRPSVSKRVRRERERWSIFVWSGWRG